MNTEKPPKTIVRAGSELISVSSGAGDIGHLISHEIGCGPVLGAA